MEQVYKKDGTVVNLLQESDIELLNVDDVLTPGQNIMFLSNRSYIIRIGKLYFMNLSVLKSNGYFSTSDEVIATFKTGTPKQIYSGCFDSYDEWRVDEVGYIALTSEIYHKSNENDRYKYTRINLFFYID